MLCSPQILCLWDTKIDTIYPLFPLELLGRQSKSGLSSAGDEITYGNKSTWIYGSPTGKYSIIDIYISHLLNSLNIPTHYLKDTG